MRTWTIIIWNHISKRYHVETLNVVCASFGSTCISAVTDMIQCWTCSFVFRARRLADTVYQTLWHRRVWDDVMFADYPAYVCWKGKVCTRLSEQKHCLLADIKPSSQHFIAACWNVYSGWDSRDEHCFACFEIYCMIFPGAAAPSRWHMSCIDNSGRFTAWNSN